MLSFKPSAIQYSDLIEALNIKHGINESNHKNDDDLLKSFCHEHLESLRGGYPNIYVFFDVGEGNYVLALSDNNQKHEVYDIDIIKGKARSMHTPAQMFVFNQAKKWDKEPFFAVCNSYGINDCMYPPLEDEGILIWVERQWHKDHRDMPANEYLNTNGVKFKSIDEAQLYINEILKKDYSLAEYETARPKYIITH